MSCNYEHNIKRKLYLAESSGLISLFGLVKLPYSSWNSTGIEKVCPTLNGPSISPIVKRSAAASENMNIRIQSMVSGHILSLYCDFFYYRSYLLNKMFIIYVKESKVSGQSLSKWKSAHGRAG